MQLAAFPSEISAGTTGTAEMNFVGSNYREYNPMVNNNSYFKEDDHGAFEPSTKSDGLSLGDLDSGNTVTTVTSSIAMETIITPTTNQSPDYNFKQYQSPQQQYASHAQKYQGSGGSGHAHQQQQYKNHKKRNKRQPPPNDIKIIHPQNQGKVKQVERPTANY